MKYGLQGSIVEANNIMNKEDAIKYSYEFLTNKEEGLGLDINRLYITVFEGDENAPRDTQAALIWKQVGIPENRIYFLNDNWWSPGESGPCGPNSEMFYDLTEKGLGDMTKEEFLKADENQDIVEIWNDVFMEYEKKDGKVIGKLDQKIIDTGAGLERLCAVLAGKKTAYDTDIFTYLLEEINKMSMVPNDYAKKIISDHIRSAVFIIASGVIPSNTDRGYILRRILRRAIRLADILQIPKDGMLKLSEMIITKYTSVYPELLKNRELIKSEIKKEENKFRQTLKTGVLKFEKIIADKKNISGNDAFILFSTYGFPFEMTKELAKEKGVVVDEKEFKKELEAHQKLSTTASAGKFKGGVGGDTLQHRKYHTATHLLHQVS